MPDISFGLAFVPTKRKKLLNPRIFSGARDSECASCRFCKCRFIVLSSKNWKKCLRELRSYILRETLEPRQLKAPSPKLTIEQLEEARKGNGSPRKRNRWPRKGNGPRRNRNRGSLIVENALNCIGSSYLSTTLSVGSRAKLLRNGQNIGPQLA